MSNVTNNSIIHSTYNNESTITMTRISACYFSFNENQNSQICRRSCKLLAFHYSNMQISHHMLIYHNRQCVSFAKANYQHNALQEVVKRILILFKNLKVFSLWKSILSIHAPCRYFELVIYDSVIITKLDVDEDQ